MPVLIKKSATFLSQVFDAYAQFEELSLSKRMEQMQEEGEEEEMAQTEKDELILDLLMARFEDLMERRPLLLNSVLLRQNPHNVAEWQKRVTLLEDKPHEVSTGLFFHRFLLNSRRSKLKVFSKLKNFSLNSSKLHN